MKKIVFLLASLVLVSCGIDPLFKISEQNPINTEITLFENGISMPLGSTTPISLSQLIDFKSAPGTPLSADEDGNLRISFTSDKPLVQSYKVEEFTLPAFKVDPATIMSVDFTTGVGSTVEFEEDIPLDQSFSIYCKMGKPEAIVAVKELSINETLSFTLSLSSGKAVLKKGFQLVFPETLTVSTKDTRFAFSGNTITAKDDIAINGNLTLSCDMVKYLPPTDCVTADAVILSGLVQMKGSAHISGKDFSPLPSNISLTQKCSAKAGVVTVGVVKIAEEVTAPEQTFDVPALPSEVKDVKFDLSDPKVSFNITNNSVLPVVLSADFSAWKDGKRTGTMNIENICIEPFSTKLVELGRENGLSELISEYPDKLSLNNLTAKSDGDEFLTIESGKEYSVSVDYAFSATLSFEKGSFINLEKELSTDITLDNEVVSIKEIELVYNALNTIPLDLSLTVVPLDSNGQKVEGLDVISETVIKAGNLDNPVTTPGSVILRATSDKQVPIKTLKVLVKCCVGDNFDGNALNTEQYLQLKNMSLVVKDGITIKGDK